MKGVDRVDNFDLAAVEAKAKLQVKVARTVLRHKLIMIGNILLVSYLVALALLVVWFIAYYATGTGMANYAAGMLNISLPMFISLNAIAYTATKLVAALLFLCPGIAFKVCGEAMKP